MKVIGIDVSKDKLECYDGSISYTIENKKAEVANFVEKVAQEQARLIYEPTGPYSLLLDFECSKCQIKVYKANPRDSKHFSEAIKNRNKNDLNDAKMLWDMNKILKEEDFQTLTVSITSQDLEDMLSYYDFIQKQTVAVKNRLESQKLKRNKWIVIQLQKELFSLERSAKEVLDKMKKAVSKNKNVLSKFSSLKSMKGIKDKTALLLTAIFLKYPNMTAKELVALSGLDPIEKTSGTSVKKKPKISKKGSILIRKMLFMPTLSMIRNNQAIRTLYLRLLDKGKSKMTAIVAIMRKVLVIAYALFRKQEMFDEEKYLSIIGGVKK